MPYGSRNREFIFQPRSHVVTRILNNQSTSTGEECEYIQQSRNVWKPKAVNAVAEASAREGMGSAVGSTSNGKLTEGGFISVKKIAVLLRK